VLKCMGNDSTVYFFSQNSILYIIYLENLQRLMCFHGKGLLYPVIELDFGNEICRFVSVKQLYVTLFNGTEHRLINVRYKEVPDRFDWEQIGS